MRELVKMAESLAEEAKRLSAVETKSVSDWSGLSADSDVEAFGSGWKGEKLFFFPTFSQLEGNRLARSFRALKGWRKVFFETTAPSSSMRRSGRRNVQDRWYAGGCAHPGRVRSLSPTKGNSAPHAFEFLGDGGWSPRLGDTFVPSGRHLEKQNWRGRRYDQSRLKTMSVDGASVREASTTTATRQAFPQPESRRTLVAFPPSRRESADGYVSISRTPLWSFGGQRRKPANVGIHTKTRTRASTFDSGTNMPRSMQQGVVNA